MNEASLTEIRTKALELHESDAAWHFHVMTPDCFLNESNRYAFVLEAPDEASSWVYFSDSAEKGLASELSPLLHGSDVMDTNSTNGSYAPSELISHMSDRAHTLNEKNIEWHHHMLFPECIFNSHAPSYVLMLEDSSTGEAMISITDDEPRDDIKQIESSFFAN